MSPRPVARIQTSLNSCEIAATKLPKVMLWLNLIFGLNFLKLEYFFQTSSIIELGCKDGAVVRALASHQCGLEAPLNGLLQTESVRESWSR